VITLGLDLGTSGMKALLLDGDATVATATAPLTVQRPAPGWSEQHPADWWQATERCLDELSSQHPKTVAAVRGIGLSGQMHGATLLGADDAVLRPCILWNDARSGAQCAELEASAVGLRRLTGNPAMAGFTAPKVLWVRQHEPAIFARIARVLCPKSWLRWKLSGEFIEDMSDASGTLWLDVAQRRWSPALLDACGLAEAHMPRLVEGSEPAGRLRAEWVRRWGFSHAPVIAGGAGDNAAGAVGVGAVAAGDAFVSLGTSGVLWATTAGFAPAPDHGVHSFCHALPGLWHQMGVQLAAAASLAWWARTCGADEAQLLAEVERARPEPASCWFLPYLSGDRTPHNDSAVRGGFLYLSSDTGRAAMTQAVLEGVAFALRDARDALATAGTRLREADLLGGGARSARWSQVLADVLGMPLHRIEGGEHGCALGAARLARTAAGGEPRYDKPHRLQSFEPDAHRAAFYDDAHGRWRALYGLARQVPAAPTLPAVAASARSA
jgi:xylulokinase